jgi:hypothetical protein
MNRLFEIRAGFPARTNHTAGVTAVLLCTAFTLCPAIAADMQAKGLQPVNLGSAAPFAVLAGSDVTNTSPSSANTVITGDLGVSPGTSVTGFLPISGGPGVVHGTIYTPTEVCIATCITESSTVAAHAQASLTVAINDAAGRVGAFTHADTDQAGLTLTPGLYRAKTILLITGGNLTLSGRGVYIFQIGTGLTVGVNAQVILTNGAQAADVFWQVGTQATLNSGVIFYGNILAGSAITMGSGTTLTGRALAKTGVTFISDTVKLP